MAQLTKTAAESLAFTEVQAFFDRLYPPVGGIAFDNLGVVTVNVLSDIGDRVFFPTADAVLHGENTGLTITTGTRGEKLITNNTGTDIDMTGWRMDVEFELVNLNFSTDDNRPTVPMRLALEVNQPNDNAAFFAICLLYTSPSPRDS